MMLKKVFMVLALAVITNCGAQTECILPDVIQSLKLESMERAAKSAKSSIEILRELEVLIPSGGEPDAPIRDKMSDSETHEFSMLAQRQRNAMLIQLMESRRQRDLDVIFDLVLAAGDRKAGRVPTSEKDERYLHHMFLEALEKTIPKPKLATFEGDDPCNLDIALFELEIVSLEWMKGISKNASDIEAEMTAACIQYGVTPDENIDMQKIPSGLRMKLQYLGEVELAPIFWNRRHVYDIERIRLLASASELMLKNNLQDVFYSGGDIKSIGNTSEEQAANGVIGENMIVAIRTWGIINESIPAKLVDELEEFSSEEN